MSGREYRVNPDLNFDLVLELSVQEVQRHRFLELGVLSAEETEQNTEEHSDQ